MNKSTLLALLATTFVARWQPSNSLADDQPPKKHHTTHDEVQPVVTTTPNIADDQPPKKHHTTHHEVPPVVTTTPNVADNQPPKKHHFLRHHLQSVVTAIPNGKSLAMVNGEDVFVDEFTGIPAARRIVTIFCSGPNPVYYHTEGNPPGFGDHDNGTVAPGQHVQYTETAATFYQPKVYVTSRYGDTKCAVIFGPVDLKTITFSMNF